MIPHKKNTSCLFFLILFIFIIGCSTVVIQPRRYFVLDYKGINEDKSLFSTRPYPYTIRILDSNISGTYNRRQIVLRTSENQIIFNQDHLWADRLPNAIPNLIQQRIARYNIFQAVSRDIQQQARYEILTLITGLEHLQFGDKYGTRLKMEFLLRRTSDNQTILRHTVDRTKSMPTKDFDHFVQNLHDLLMEETDMFLRAFIYHRRSFENVQDITDEIVFNSEEYLETYKTANINLEYLEEEQIGLLGRLIIPSKTEPDREPHYTIEDLEGNFVGSYEMGEEVYLLPGKYQVFIGNGTMGQKVVTEVEVYPSYKTVLEPDVGWITIDIIDDLRNQIDLSYELYNLENAESIGFGFGVREGSAQLLDSWILKPGLYKIILRGEPYNTVRNFATVEVKKGELVEFTIVVDEENNLIGAGQLFERNFLQNKGKINISIMNHLNGNVNSINNQEKNKNQWSTTLTNQLDTKVTYDAAPYYYNLKNIIEVGVFRDTNTKLKINTDRFDLKNTFIYFFIKNLGLYGRADINTHLFEEYVHTNTKKDYLRINKKGQETEEKTDLFIVKEPFFPLVMKQGVGINYRVLNKNRANLNLRTGLGLRQDLNRNVYIFERSDPYYDVYREVKSVNQNGIEFSLNGNFQILRDLNYTTNADILLPSGKNSSKIYEWENIFNLRMIKYISWDYRLYIEFNKQNRTYALIDHSLFLRFTYIFLK